MRLKACRSASGVISWCKNTSMTVTHSPAMAFGSPVGNTMGSCYHGHEQQLSQSSCSIQSAPMKMVREQVTMAAVRDSQTGDPVASCRASTLRFLVRTRDGRPAVDGVLSDELTSFRLYEARRLMDLVCERGRAVRAILASR
jgi:hypothetical protein